MNIYQAKTIGVILWIQSRQDFIKRFNKKNYNHLIQQLYDQVSNCRKRMICPGHVDPQKKGLPRTVVQWLSSEMYDTPTADKTMTTFPNS